jgi:CobQ-like glutamine amidotransferase family enzyme
MKTLNIVHLYPNEMNTYGDRGNILALVRRCEWYGYQPVVHHHHAGDELPREADIVLGGGGQDSAQAEIQLDIQQIAERLYELTANNTPMLMVCGSYQLLGRRFVTQDEREIKGIGIFDAETYGGGQRLIGNVRTESDFAGPLFGFENHSGRTYLARTQEPLGLVTRGNGNNGEDKTEGARTNNVFGTYLHGPVLPNNPRLADLLIQIAATNRYGEFAINNLDDSLATLAREAALKRAYY